MAGLALVLGCCVIAGGVLLLARQPQRGVLPDDVDRRTPASERASPSEVSEDARADATTALLGRLVAGLERGSRQQVVALGADRRAGSELATLRRNVRTLGVTDLSMRYVGEAGRPPAAQHQRFGEETWVGTVGLRWRLRGFDAHPSRLEVPVTFQEHGSRARFVTARLDTGDPAPMWLLDTVQVERTPRSLVVTSGARPAARYSRLAERAVADVLAVMSRWPGRLVVEIPDAGGGIARVLGSEPADYADIAAVTTTADGSARADAPVHVFVNLEVFDPLGPRASQIVMSHEATHVATGAALTSMPAWLLEGFADYVALDHVDLPVEVAASQILAQVRRDGAPERLPARPDFDSRSTGIGAAYESAWLACRLLGETYGERKLVEFYRAVDRDSSTTRAFRTVLGTDQAAFTRAWRSELRRLAG